MVALDNTLVRGYTHDRRSKQPSGEYLADFKKGAKNLRYIAASHEQVGKANPTINLIDKAFQNEKPDFVVIERQAYKSSRDGYKASPAGQNEAEYAAYLAQQNNIPFMGAEPNDADVFQEMLAKGYSERDVMGLYLLRVIPSGEEATRDSASIPFQSEKQLAKFADHYFSSHSCFNSIPPDRRLNYQSFKQWFDEKNQGAVQRPIWQFSSEDAAPVDVPTANYFQRLNHYVGLVREESINRTIEAALQKHDNVMVVYGGGHLVQSLPVYEKALGKPAYITANQMNDATPAPAASLQQNISEFMRKPSNVCFTIAAAATATAVFFTGIWIPAAVTAASSFALGAYRKQQEEIAAHPQLTMQENALQPARERGCASGLAASISYRNDHATRYLANKNTARERHL